MHEDPPFRLAFTRLVTHYRGNAAFQEDGQLMRDAGRLAGIPTFLAHGRRDISGPADIAEGLARVIPGAELHVSETDGHGGPQMVDRAVSVLDRLASQRASSSIP
jgi:proline iminopeptidase